MERGAWSRDRSVVLNEPSSRFGKASSFTFSRRTTSPSSFVKSSGNGAGRILRTTSEGRHSRTPREVNTNGRLIRMGCASIASSSLPSVSDASPRPSSS